MSDQQKRTPLFDQHQKLGAKLVPFAGYEMPIQYDGIVVEHTRVRNQAGLFDVSHMGELRLQGDQALDLANWLVTGDLSRAENGQALYACACNDAGTILDDLILYRSSPDNILIVCNASNHAKIWDHVTQEAKKFPRADIIDESEETALIAVQGPKAFEVLTQTDPNLGDLRATLRPFRFARRKLGADNVTIARTGYTGEEGVEIFCQANKAEKIWLELLEHGAPFGIGPAGLGARDTLRLEARLSLYGNEIDETTTPFEAGLGWTVKLQKPNFLGKSALVLTQEAGLSRTLIGFEMIGRGVARSGYPLLNGGGAVVGHCTSGSPSPTLGKAIGLGYLPVEMSAEGTEFEVDCRGKRIVARVVPTPFYKRSVTP